MKNLPILLFLAILFSSCLSTHQAIVLNTHPDNTILVNGKKASFSDSKLLLEKDARPKQITAKREGFKDENITIIQYKEPSYYLLAYVMLPRTNNHLMYETRVDLGNEMQSMPRKDSLSKNITINSVDIEMLSKESKYRFFSNYYKYKNKKYRSERSFEDSDEEIKVENTIYSETLNDKLKTFGYIDTTRHILKHSFGKNLLLNTTITRQTINVVNSSLSGNYGGLVFTDLDLLWKIQDYYGQDIYSFKTKAESGEFAYQQDEKMPRAINKAIKDAVLEGLYEFMNIKTVDSVLKSREDERIEMAFSQLELKSGDSCVSNLSEAVKSTVTITFKEGHASGFFIDKKGHLITNYHAITDTANLKVVTSDGSVYSPHIIRTSKLNDLALLKIDTCDVLPFELKTSKEIELAKDIYAIGTPSAEDLSQTISKGIISAIRHRDNATSLIQLDASVNAGNSGGCLIDQKGLVYGVISQKIVGIGIEGVAFAIPSFEILNRLKITFN